MGKFLTHDEFMIKFNKTDISKTVIILGVYVKSTQEIECFCTVHKTIFFRKPSGLMRGWGCTKCGIDTRNNKKKKSHEEFLNLFMQKNKNSDNIELLSKYNGSRDKIKCRCKIHVDYVWDAMATNLLSGNGCRLCAIESIKRANKKDHEQFLSEFSKMENFSKIKLLGEYEGATTGIACECEIHRGYIWFPTPSALLNGKGCVLCSNENNSLINRKSHEEFMIEFSETRIFPYIEMIGKYTTQSEHIKCRCLIHDIEFESLPKTLLKAKYGCPICALENSRLTNDEYDLLLNKREKKFKRVGNYKNTKTRLLHACLNCGHEVNIAPRDMLYRDVLCGICDPNFGKSHGEKQITEYLILNGIQFSREHTFPDCRNVNLLKFDFAIFHNDDLFCLIEYDGEQHYIASDYFGGDDTFKKTKDRDNIKNKYCSDNYIKLIRIPYWDFKNINDILDRELLEIIL